VIEFERFKEDDDVLILIVVGRGILGFDNPKLVTVIDFTGSRNINRIFRINMHRDCT